MNVNYTYMYIPAWNHFSFKTFFMSSHNIQVSMGIGKTAERQQTHTDHLHR